MLSRFWPARGRGLCKRQKNDNMLTLQILNSRNCSHKYYYKILIALPIEDIPRLPATRGIEIRPGPDQDILDVLYGGEVGQQGCGHTTTTIMAEREGNSGPGAASM